MDHHLVSRPEPEFAHYLARDRESERVARASDRETRHVHMYYVVYYIIVSALADDRRSQRDSPPVRDLAAV